MLYKNRDYLIIGQGLAGSALAWELVQRGKSVIVYDKPSMNQSSSKAAGIFNPITSRVMSLSWKGELIFPFLKNFYQGAEKILQKKFLNLTSIYRPFISLDEKEQWKKRIALNEKHLFANFTSCVNGKSIFDDQVHNPFGGVEYNNSGYLNVPLWLSSVSVFLKKIDSYCHEMFDESDLLCLDQEVYYKEWRVKKIVFCQGLYSNNSRWFSWVPIIPLKGELLHIKTNTVLHRIYNRRVFIVPSPMENIFTVGSTYVHSPFVEATTVEVAKDLLVKIKSLMRISFEVTNQTWGIRPTTHDRFPILGHHPDNKNVIIFNGLGTKGVSLSPYFANQLANWVDGKENLDEKVCVNRYKKY